jgi:hypothetical protein
MHASAKSIYSSTGKNFARAEKSMFTELGPVGLFVAVMLEEMSAHSSQCSRCLQDSNLHDWWHS